MNLRYSNILGRPYYQKTTSFWFGLEPPIHRSGKNEHTSVFRATTDLCQISSSARLLEEWRTKKLVFDSHYRMAKSMGAWPSIKLPTEKNIAVPKLDSPSSSNGGTRFKDDSNLSVGW